MTGALVTMVLGGLLAGGVMVFGDGLLGNAQVAPPTSDAQPYLRRDFANDLEGEVRTKLPRPEVYTHAVPIDGCDRNYGVKGECVPYNFPPKIAETPAAKCAYLASNKFSNLDLVGEDRHDLVPAGAPVSPRGNPYACPAELPTGS